MDNSNEEQGWVQLGCTKIEYVQTNIFIPEAYYKL